MRRLLKPKLKHVFATVYTGKCCCCFEKWELKHKVVLLCMWRSRSVTGYVAPLVTCNAVVYGGREHTTTNFPFYFLEFHKNSPIERFHSRGQQVCKFNGTIESVYIRKEFNSHRIGSEGQHSFNRDLTTRQRRRPWKRHWKNRLRILSYYFAIITSRPVALKEGNLGWSWREGPRPSSDRDWRINPLAVSVLK